MRKFEDGAGRAWTARVQEREGLDYKGRFHLVFEAGDGETAELVDVRWNSLRTAERTLLTMSQVELRRRLASARGRSVTL